jgi:hypothetical protein
MLTLSVPFCTFATYTIIAAVAVTPVVSAAAAFALCSLLFVATNAAAPLSAATPAEVAHSIARLVIFAMISSFLLWGYSIERIQIYSLRKNKEVHDYLPSSSIIEVDGF